MVGALFGLGTGINAVRAVFEGELWFLLPAGVSMLFWYWIGMGAYRRASSR